MKHLYIFHAVRLLKAAVPAESASEVEEAAVTAASANHTGFLIFLSVLMIILILITAALTVVLISVEIRQKKNTSLIRKIQKCLDELLKRVTDLENAYVKLGPKSNIQLGYDPKQGSGDRQIIRQETTRYETKGKTSESAEKSNQADYSATFQASDASSRRIIQTDTNRYQIEDLGILSDDLDQKQGNASNEAGFGNPTDNIVIEEGGVAVSESVRYNSSFITFYRVSSSNAKMELNADGTVVPSRSSKRSYNTASYFTQNGFLYVFDFRMENGKKVELEGSVKIIEVRTPAMVSVTENLIRLTRKGTLIVEVR